MMKENIMSTITQTENQTQVLDEITEIPIRKISFTLRYPDATPQDKKPSNTTTTTTTHTTATTTTTNYNDNKGYTIKEAKEKDRKLAYYQGVIFYTLYAGYAFYTYARKVFSYAAPTIIGLGLLSQSHVGIVNSSQYFAYAISKFLGGILSDKVSAKLLFPVGLFISGCSAIAVPFTSDANLWAFLWFVNGLGQGCGWPACSKLLKKWFSKKQFGTYWSVLSTSSNLSGAVGPFFAASCFVLVGWKACFIISGSITVMLGVASLLLLKDSPKEVNLDPPCVEYEVTPAEAKNGEKPSKDAVEGTYSQLVKSPLLWIISFCYLVVFGTKTALSDWGQVFLMEELQQSQIQASAFNSAIEAGGFVGGVLAGVITDKYSSKLKGQGNARLLISCLFMMVCVFSLHILTFMTSLQTSQIIISITGMALGASLFGPITIFGIVASESFASSISGASHAVVALAANVGAIAAGWPFSKLSLMCGWKTCFCLCQFLLTAAIFVVFSTRKYQGRKLKET